jgi:hypothetical protein
MQGATSTPQLHERPIALHTIENDVFIAFGIDHQGLDEADHFETG